MKKTLGWIVVGLVVGCSGKDSSQDSGTNAGAPAGTTSAGTPAGSTTPTGTTPSTTRPQMTGTFGRVDAFAEIFGTDGVQRIGSAVSSAGDVNGDGFEDLLIGTTEDDTAAAEAGAMYLMHGPFSGQSSVTTAAARLTGESAGDHAGWLAIAGGDINGDGIDDIVFQSHRYELPEEHVGAVGIFFGPVTGDHTITSGDITIRGDGAMQALGMGLTSLGDVDGDGTDDLAIGAFMTEPAGEIGIWTSSLVPGAWTRSDADASFLGEAAGGNSAGQVIASLGDADGDGLADLLIGDSWVSLGDGAAYQVHAPYTGTTDLGQADGILRGTLAADAWLGIQVAAGDIDGDGLGEPIVATYSPNTVLLFDDGLSGTRSRADATAQISLPQGDGALTSPGDVDGDGVDDLLVSGPRLNDDDGLVLLYYGPFTGTQTQATASARWTEPGLVAFFGTGLASGDFDADGFLDLAIGAVGTGDGVQNTGSILLFDGF